MQFAFGAQWDTRAAQRKSMTEALKASLSQPNTRILPLWRGKPQLLGNALAWVGPDHPMLAQTAQPYLYLGQSEGADIFAADLSGWEPEALDRTALAMFTDTSIQIHPDAPKGAQFSELRLAMAHLPPEQAAMAASARAIYNWHRTHQFCAACGAASIPAQAGWERHCPACGAKHFPRTDPVVIMLVTRANQLLLGRSPGWPERMYSALAGFIEPGETLETAVAREVLEETGLPTRNIRYIASQPWPFPNSLMFGCAAEAASAEIVLDEELEDARWLSREDVLAAWSGQHPEVLPARKGSIAHYLIGQWLAGHV